MCVLFAIELKCNINKQKESDLIAGICWNMIFTGKKFKNTPPKLKMARIALKRSI